MRNKLVVLLLPFFVLSCFFAFANPVQKMTLKDGSVLEGYISAQRPGENFSFTTDKAVIYISSKSVLSIVDHEVNVGNLSKEWIDWADKNDAFVGVGDNKALTLSDIVTSTGRISQVRVLEKGAKMKYLEICSNTYSLIWDTIQVVSVEKRSKKTLSGINRSYKMASGVEYEGQYVEEVPGKTLSLYCNNGIVEVLETNKIIKNRIIPINLNQSIFEQSELIDDIVLKNGSNLNGIIIEQNYNVDKSKDSYLLIRLEDNSIQTVNLLDVIEYRKKPNKLYKPLFDVLLKKGEILINREETKPMPIIEENSHVFLKSDSCNTIISKDSLKNGIVVEAYLEEDLLAKELEIVKVKTYKERKKTLYGFTYEDIVKSSIQPISIVTSINKTTKMIFPIKQPGFYVVYNSKDKTSIPFIIK